MGTTTLFILVVLSFAQGQRPLVPDLPDPRIVLDGATGAGNSSLANALTIDDILEENARLKYENKWLNDVIRNNITQLTEMIQRNAEKINANEGQIQDNVGNIQDNADNLGIVEVHVNSMDGDIVSTNRRIDENKAYIEQNTANIDENEIKIDENADIINKLHLAPIGTISAWVTKPMKETVEDEMVSLPEGWVRCDGATIPEPSVWAGQLTPNLNGEKRFLRGASDSEVLNLEEDQMQDHKHQVSDPGHFHKYDDYSNHADGEDGHWGPGSRLSSDISGERAICKFSFYRNAFTFLKGRVSLIFLYFHKSRWA